MNQPPSNPGFQPQDVDRVIDQYGRPLRGEHRKALTDRLRDERARYETSQREKALERRERGDRRGGR